MNYFLTLLGKRLRLGNKSRIILDLNAVQEGGNEPYIPSEPEDLISGSIVVIDNDITTNFTVSLTPSCDTFDHFEYTVNGQLLSFTTTSSTIPVESVIEDFELTAPNDSTQDYVFKIRGVSTRGNYTQYTTKTFTVEGETTVRTFWTTKFNPVEDVICSAEPNEGDRVIIVCRHSERSSDSGGSGTLTDTGIQWAKDNGTRIKASCQSANKFTDTSNDYYASTTVPRCRQTAYFIGMGRGYSAYNNNSFNGSSNPSNFRNPSCIGAYDLISGIGGMQNGGDIDWLALSVLTDDHFSEVKARVDQKVPAIISETNGHPFSLLVTHDLFMVPMIETMFPDIQFQRTKVAGKENQTGKGTNTGEWCGYMSGVCFIVHQDGTYDVWPIEGVEGNNTENTSSTEDVGKFQGQQN